MQVLEHVCLRTVLGSGIDRLHQAAVAARVERSHSLGVHLNLASQMLGPAFSLACKFIPNAHIITSADVSWNTMDAMGAQGFSHCIKNMSSLRRLDVSNNAMTPHVAELLSHGIMYATTLTELSLSGNKLCAEGFQRISTALFALTHLEVLDLSDNDLCVSTAHVDAIRENEDCTASHHPPPTSVLGVVALNVVLERSTSLRELVLSGNMLGAIGVQV
jgi:Leucine-rich repeat (LRR) protein